MPTNDFERALVITLKFEGGYSNHPNDPGGETNYGITQRVYDKWRRSRGLLERSVKFIENREVQAIYREKYWDAVNCDEYPWPVNMCLFDWTVNSGSGVSLPALRRTGPDAEAYLKERWAFLERLIKRRPLSAIFRKGWARRVNALCDLAGVPHVATSSPRST